MKRNVKALLGSNFDLLVIGGGIYGAWTAYDAALRGLSVALVDKGDWASGTSSRSSKLIHGGLRYLEKFRLGLVQKSLRERIKLTRLAPHRIKDLKFLIPLYRDNRVGPLRLRLGLWMYDSLVKKKDIVYLHQFLNREESLSNYPFLASKGLNGILTYGDCQTDDFRCTLEIINGAYKSGVASVNYLEVKDLIIRKNRVIGAKVLDHLSQDTFEIFASVVVNASGPWLTQGKPDGTQDLVRLTKGAHLILPPYNSNDAILGMSNRDGRVFFIIPWYGKTLLGTTDTNFTGNPDQLQIEEEDVDYLLGEANRILRDQDWNRSSILGHFVGLRALRNERGKSPSSVSRDWSLKNPMGGLLISIGGKFTSARCDAATIVDQVMEFLNKKPQGQSPTESRLFPWCPSDPFDEWKKKTIDEGVQLGLDQEVAEWCVARFGTSIREIHRVIRADPSLTERIDADIPFAKVEIIHGVKNEMALNLDDVLRRRIPLLLLTPANKEVLQRTANLIAPILRWTDKECQNQIENTFERWSSL